MFETETEDLKISQIHQTILEIFKIKDSHCFRFFLFLRHDRLL